MDPDHRKLPPVEKLLRVNKDTEGLGHGESALHMLPEDEGVAQRAAMRHAWSESEPKRRRSATARTNYVCNILDRIQGGDTRSIRESKAASRVARLLQEIAEGKHSPGDAKGKGKGKITV